MKKNLFLLLLIPSLFFSQEQEIGITGLTISPINTSEVSVNLITICGTAFSYINHTLNLSNNTIDINVCYRIYGFTIVDEDMRNFNVQIPNDGIYTLNIKCFTSNTSPVCNYFFLEDLATLNFNFPLTEPVSLSNYNFEKSMIGSVIFPNPFHDSFSISDVVGKDEDFEFKISDVAGRVVKFGKVFNDEKINTEALLSGTYILEIQDKNGNRSLKKVVKN